MASFVFTNCYAMINSVDLSDHVESIKINYKGAALDNTAMSVTSKSFIAGLKDWDVDITFNQDYASGKVDATLFGLVGAAAVAISFRPDAGVQSATNPTFSGNALLPTYEPMGGKVGDVAKATAKFQGTGTLTRTAT